MIGLVSYRIIFENLLSASYRTSYSDALNGILNLTWQEFYIEDIIACCVPPGPDETSLMLRLQE